MGRRLPCRPRRTLSIVAVLGLVGCVSFYAGRQHEPRHSSLLAVPAAPAPPPSPPSSLPAPAPVPASALPSNGIADGDSQRTAATPSSPDAAAGAGLHVSASGGGSMCVSGGSAPVVDISAEQLAKMERCLAIPPQVVRKPSKASLDATGVPMPGMQAHPRTAAAIFVGKRNVMSMNRGLKDRGVAILASIYNVSRMSSESRRRLERADFIYTNDRPQMRAVRAWQDRALAAAAAAWQAQPHGTNAVALPPPPQQHAITNSVEAFYNRGFTSKDGLPSNIRRLYAAEGCEMGGSDAAHLMPSTLTLPDTGADAATIARCNRWFAERGVVRHGGVEQGLRPRLLLKPTLGSQGKGITLHANLSTLLRDTQRGWPCDPAKDERFGGAASVSQQTAKQKRMGLYVVQSYIEPLLLHGRKFDIRMYVLVASTEPVVLFWREGYIRRALQPYDPTAMFAGNEGMHITNTHRQKKLHDYKPKSHIWSMAQLREYLATHNGVDSLRLFNRRMSTFVPWAARTVVQALAESQHATSGGRVRDSADWVRNGTFQLIGLDFMVDENMEFSFIEGNPRPGLDQETRWQSRYMVDMVGELVEIVFEIHTGKPLTLGKKPVRSVARHRLWSGESVGVSHAAYGNWRMLWHEKWQECGSVNYSPLNLCRRTLDQDHGSSTAVAIPTTTPQQQQAADGSRIEPPSGTARSWPCLFPRGTIPYDSYPAAVRRRDAEEEASKPPGDGEACAPAAVAAAAARTTRAPGGQAGLTHIVIIGTTAAGSADSGDGVLTGVKVARQQNCACLERVLHSVAPPSTSIQVVPPTTPTTLATHPSKGGEQGWQAQLIKDGTVASTGAKVLKQERLSDLATALSHIKLWQDFVAGSYDSGGQKRQHLLVMEDDASLPDSFCWTDVTKRLEAAPAGWSMISLFEFDPYRNRGKKKRLPKTWDSTPLKLCPEASSVTAEEREAAVAAAATVRVRHHALGMVGYVLSRTGAERLLKLMLPLKDKAIDQVLTDIVRKQRLGTDGVFVSHPPLVHHDYLLGSQRRDQNKAASKQAAASGNDAVVELALSEELGIANDGSLMATGSLAGDVALLDGSDGGVRETEAAAAASAAKALEEEGFAVASAADDSEDELVRPDFDSDPPPSQPGASVAGTPAGAQLHLMTKGELEAEVLALRAKAQQREGG